MMPKTTPKKKKENDFGRKMKDAPIYHALAQAQFNPINLMANYINKIQDLMRKLGYPDFQTQQVTQIQFNPQQGVLAPMVVNSPSWTFLTPSKTEGFHLALNAITYHTTDYETSTTFLPKILQGLKVVHKVVDLSFVSRLGLRYLDAAFPKESEELNDYLEKEVHGIAVEGRHKQSLSEVIFETNTGPLINNGTLVARVYKVTGPLSYPPDLATFGLIPKAKFANQKPLLHAILDTDHFVEGTMKIDEQALAEQLGSLHSKMRQIFDSSTTSFAREVWLKGANL